MSILEENKYYHQDILRLAIFDKTDCLIADFDFSKKNKRDKSFPNEQTNKEKQCRKYSKRKGERERIHVR